MILYFLTDHPILSTRFYMSDTVMVNKKINSAFTLLYLVLKYFR